MAGTDKDKALELALLTAIEFPSDVATLRKIGIQPSDFHDRTYRGFYEHLISSITRDGKLPTIEDKRQMWGLPLEEKHSDVYGLGQSLKKLRLSSSLARSIVTAHDLVKEDPESAISYLESQFRGLTVADSSRARILESESVNRLKELEKRAAAKEAGEFIGLRMGLACLDESNIGAQPGELITLQGRSGIGKSWFLIRFCTMAYLDGKKVLYLSPEMSAFETELRCDVFLMYAYNFRTSHKGLVTGDADYLEEYKRYVEHLEKEREERWVTIDSDKAGSFTLGAIHELVDKYRPDVLAIDGFHLLAGSKNGQGWEGVKQNSDGIKNLALNKGITVFVVTQARRTVGMYDNPNNDEIGYGHSLVEASDLVLSATGVKGAPDRRKLKVTKRRSGELPMFRISMLFDVDHGVIEEQISEMEDEEFDDELSVDDI